MTRIEDVVRPGANIKRIQSRLMQHVNIVPDPVNCWLWINPHNDDGLFYLSAKEVANPRGLLNPKGKHVSARRLSFLLSGEEIPKLCHLTSTCGRPCINPEHLRLLGKRHDHIYEGEI